MPEALIPPSEPAETLALWKAVYAELFPHRNPEAMRVDDDALALAVMLRRELRAVPGVVRIRVIRRLDEYRGNSE